jgi:hypothetical protein
MLSPLEHVEEVSCGGGGGGGVMFHKDRKIDCQLKLDTIKRLINLFSYYIYDL